MSPLERGETTGGRWKSAPSLDSTVATPLKSPLEKGGRSESKELLQGPTPKG